MIRARIRKIEWQARGGCANPHLFRRMRRGVWTYWWCIR